MLDSLASVSKYRQPMLPRVLQRERLFRRLRDNLDKNLWLIIGQAAQGKTTLISAWAALSPVPTAWLKLEPEDAPIENLFISLVNSLSVALGEDLSRLISEADLGSRPQLSEGELLHMARLIFQAAPPGTEFVLDGVNLLPTDAPSLRLLSALIKALPPDRRLIVISRQNLPGQDEMIISRQALLLGNEELGCNLQEVSDFLELLTGKTPTAQQVRDIDQLCEGWLGGVVLCAETMPQVDGRKFGDPLTQDAADRARDGFFRFFGRNIFDQLSRRTRKFLLNCAPFKVLDPRVMAILTQERDTQLILDELCQKHMFIKPLMDEKRGRVYRLHQLFSEFLNQRYREEYSEPQHRYYMARAGHVLAEEGYWEEALGCHLQARQFDAAAAVIKRLAPDLEATGRYIELGRWLEGLPPKLVESDPWLHYYLCQSRRWSGLRHNLKVLPRVLEDFRRAHDDRGRLRAQTALIFAAFTGGLPWSMIKAFLDEAEALLAEVDPEKYRHERAALLSQLGFAHAVRGMARKAAWACEQAYVIARQVGDDRLAMQALTHHMDALNFMGELAEAERIRGVMDELIRQVKPAELPVIQFVPRCYLHLLRGELDLAKPILDQSRALIAERGISYLLPVVQVYNLLYAVLSGDNVLARELAGLMRNRLDGTATPFLRAAAGVLLSMSFARAGDYQQGWDVAEQALEELSTDEARAGTHVATGLINMALCGRRLGQAGEALVAEVVAAREILRDIGSRQYQTEAEFLLSLLCADTGESEDARLWLKSAMDRCRKKGYRYFIVLLPEDLTDLVALAVELHEPESARFLADLLAGRTEAPYQRQMEALLHHAHPEVRELAADVKRQEKLSQAPRLDVTTLNGFQVQVGGRPIEKRQWGRKQVRHLFMAILALGPDGVPRDQLMDAFWPDANPDKAEKSLRVALHRLRRALEPDLDQTAGSSYLLAEDNLVRLNPDKCQLDFQEFRRVLKEAGEKEAQGGVREALELLEQAIQMYSSDFLAEEPYLDFCQETRRRLREEYLGALERIARLYEKRGHLARAASAYQRLIQADPLGEQAYQRLMSLQAQLGLISEAMRTYQDCRDKLNENLDMEPGWVTTSLYEKIKKQAE